MAYVRVRVVSLGGSISTHSPETILGTSQFSLLDKDDLMINCIKPQLFINHSEVLS